MTTQYAMSCRQYLLQVSNFSPLDKPDDRDPAFTSYPGSAAGLLLRACDALHQVEQQPVRLGRLVAARPLQRTLTTRLV